MTLYDASRGGKRRSVCFVGFNTPPTVIWRHGVMDCRTLREELATDNGSRKAGAKFPAPQARASVASVGATRPEGYVGAGR